MDFNTKFVVTVRSTEDPNYKHEMDVSKILGTSNYDRVLDDLLQKVDWSKYWVDRSDADAEHQNRKSGMKQTWH